MAAADFSGILNPKRVIARREAEAEEPPPKASAPKGMRFGKQFTPEDRAKHNAALVKKLRERQ